MRPISEPITIRFGRFTFNPRSGELWTDGGDVVKLAPQPTKVLALLARRTGDVVSREEIRQQLWPNGTFVDFDQGLNFCIRQIREALADNAEVPQCIQTLPRRGYRFLPPIDCGPASGNAPKTRLIVLPFRMLRADPEMDFLAFSLPDAITSALSSLESMVVRSSMVATHLAGMTDPKTLASEADVDVVLTGSLLRAGDHLRVSAQLTEVPIGTLRWSQTSDVALGDIFQLQDDLTTRIVDSLALPLSPKEQTLLKRDVPSSASAYELYLRANQLSRVATHWAAARDLYLQCVGEDPGYAPAWARLGRILHVIAKWSGIDAAENLHRADAAFKHALEANPDHPLAHKFYAQLETDRGGAEAAMARLLRQARSADPDLFAGLVTVCRYCGLLDASIAADTRARRLDQRVSTSVVHTWFLRGDDARVAGTRLEENPYIVALSFANIGRASEAIEQMRNLEGKIAARKADFMTVALTLLEGKVEDSIAAANRIAHSDFCDPEGLFYMARHLAHLNEIDRAIDLLERVIGGGFCCHAALTSDPWFTPLRAKAKFTDLIRRAAARHRHAASTFIQMRGDALLGVGFVSNPRKARSRR